jgi:hypothetical protein
MEFEEIKRLSDDELDNRIKDLSEIRFQPFISLFYEDTNLCQDLTACNFVEKEVLSSKQRMDETDILAKNIPIPKEGISSTWWGVFSGLNFTARQRCEAILWALTKPPKPQKTEEKFSRHQYRQWEKGSNPPDGTYLIAQQLFTAENGDRFLLPLDDQAYELIDLNSVFEHGECLYEFLEPEKEDFLL